MENKNLDKSFIFCLFIILISFAHIACNEEPSTPPPEMMDDPQVFGRGGMEMGGEEAGSEGGVIPEQNNLKTYLTYTRVVSEGGDTRGDLIVFDFDRDEEIVLNEGVPKDQLDCITRGCLIHPNLTWVGWMERDGGANSLWVAPIDRSSRSVLVDERTQVSDNILRFDFTENLIVYSEIKDANTANGIAIKTMTLDGNATTAELGLVDANGGFSVTASDDLFILIKTTLASMNLSFFNAANGQLFDLFTFGEGMGTGSEFSANTNPVVLAPDNTFLVTVTNNNFMWRVHSLEVTDALVEPVSQDLFPTANVETACMGNYPFIRVLNQPIFTKDSEHFYLMFGGDCAGTNRLDYEIYRFSRDVTQAPVNVTQIPRVNHWSNHDISSFALSPDESQIAFVSTRPSRNGTKSIWMMNISTDGEPPTFDCSRYMGQPDLSGGVRCEYIYTDSDGQVDYKNISFKEAASF